MGILNPAERRDNASIAASYQNPRCSRTGQIRLLMTGKLDPLRKIGQVSHCLLSAVEPQVLRRENVVRHNVAARVIPLRPDDEEAVRCVENILEKPRIDVCEIVGTIFADGPDYDRTA